jgi:hypothetical protein
MTVIFMKRQTVAVKEEIRGKRFEGRGKRKRF